MYLVHVLICLLESRNPNFFRLWCSVQCPAWKQHSVFIGWMLWWPRQSTRWEEGVSYVVKILACSVTVPATVNPKAFLPSSDSLYEFLSGFPSGSVVKNLPASTGAMGSIPGSGRSPREGNGTPLQCSRLVNPMDRGAWQAAVYGAAKSRTWLSDTPRRAWRGQHSVFIGGMNKGRYSFSSILLEQNNVFAWDDS